METLRMDEKGYTFTPLVFLLFIPVMVVAVSYGGIVEEANTIVTIAIGGDVTHQAMVTLISAVEKGTSDAGRNSAFNATRTVIDRADVKGTNPFFPRGQSKTHIINNILPILNVHVITTAREIENQTGREIFINNISIHNHTNAVFRAADINITQNDPFGFHVNIRGGIPIRIVQKDHVFEGRLPPISSYVSIEGLEDPYIWVNSRFRQSNVFYRYPHYRIHGNEIRYFFDETVDRANHRLNFLWDCLNGTGNLGNITPRPFYFPNPWGGLTFFDRLENNRNSTNPNNRTWISTFIIGHPLAEEHGRGDTSRLDVEYFRRVPGSFIEIGTGQNRREMRDPSGTIFYLSGLYKTRFGLESSYRGN